MKREKRKRPGNVTWKQPVRQLLHKQFPVLDLINLSFKLTHFCVNLALSDRHYPLPTSPQEFLHSPSETPCHAPVPPLPVPLLHLTPVFPSLHPTHNQWSP